MGYQNSISFYKQCRQLGYPIIYKGIVGLGHADNPYADQLGIECLKYALTVKDQRDALDERLNHIGETESGMNPWISSFRNPPFMGDIVNQGMVSADQKDLIPRGFQVALPTKQIADLWNQSP